MNSESEEEIHFISGGIELLDSIETMWLKLKDFHIDQFPIWRDGLQLGSFQERQTGFKEIAESGAILIEIARQGDRSRGFCVTTITPEGVGEIASLYVEEEFRQQGLGSSFVKQALQWLRDYNVERIVVDVMAGNTSALNLYEQAGFQCRVQQMQFVAPISQDGEISQP